MKLFRFVFSKNCLRYCYLFLCGVGLWSGVAQAASPVGEVFLKNETNHTLYFSLYKPERYLCNISPLAHSQFAVPVGSSRHFWISRTGCLRNHYDAGVTFSVYAGAHDNSHGLLGFFSIIPQQGYWVHPYQAFHHFCYVPAVTGINVRTVRFYFSRSCPISEP